MALVLFYTERVKRALAAPAVVGVDALLMMGRQVTSTYHHTVVISRSFWMLPKYTLFSLLRGCAAYVLSLAFALVYGTIAAHNRRAEKAC